MKRTVYFRVPVAFDAESEAGLEHAIKSYTGDAGHDVAGCNVDHGCYGYVVGKPERDEAEQAPRPPIKGFVNMPHPHEPGYRIVGVKFKNEEWPGELYLPIEWLMALVDKNGKKICDTSPRSEPESCPECHCGNRLNGRIVHAAHCSKRTPENAPT